MDDFNTIHMPVKQVNIKNRKEVLYSLKKSIPESFKEGVKIRLGYLKTNYDNDEDVVLLAVQHKGNFLRHASIRLKNNDNIVMTSVRSNPLSLQAASDRLKDNEDVVNTAVKLNGLALIFASDRLKNDSKVVSNAVNQNGLALEYASDRLKNEIKIAKIAIQQHPIAIKHVSQKLKDDDELVNLAISKEAFALQFASLRCKLNVNFIKKALLQNLFYLKHLTDYPEIKELPEIIELSKNSIINNSKYYSCFHLSSIHIHDDVDFIEKLVNKDYKAIEHTCYFFDMFNSKVLDSVYQKDVIYFNDFMETYTGIEKTGTRDLIDYKNKISSYPSEFFLQTFLNLDKELFVLRPKSDNVIEKTVKMDETLAPDNKESVFFILKRMASTDIEKLTVVNPYLKECIGKERQNRKILDMIQTDKKTIKDRKMKF